MQFLSQPFKRSVNRLEFKGVYMIFGPSPGPSYYFSPFPKAGRYCGTQSLMLYQLV